MMLRGLAGIRRRLVYVLFASVLSFLFYLLVTTNSQIHTAQVPKDGRSIIFSPSKRSPLIDALKPQTLPSGVITAPQDSNAVRDHLDLNHQPQHQQPQVMEQQHNNVQEQQQQHQPDTNNVMKLTSHKAAAAVGQTGVKPAPADPPTARVTTSPPPAAPSPRKMLKPQGPYSGPTNDRQRAVVSAFKHAYGAYKKYAWGHDELKPVSKGWQEWMGIGLTIVDSLDTMWIMGLSEEFNDGREWVANNLQFTATREVQLFEIVIRELGGLMSAYHLSGDKMFLDKALDLGNKLMPCFLGTTPIPCNRISMGQGRPSFIEISTAEAGTIQLEFRALARAVKDPKYENAVDAVSQYLHGMKKLDGLVATFINPHTGQFRQGSTVSAGASADSYYEYLLKQWIQTGKTRDWLRDDYLEAIEGIRRHLYRYTEPSHLAFVGAYNSLNGHSFRPEMEHLACFLPGTIALGNMAGLGGSTHLAMAENLTRTCYEMYRRMPTGLSPEVAYMNINPGSPDREDITAGFQSAHNLQRPEAIESIFYMYRATGNRTYQEWGWNIFQAFEKYTKLPDGGYASISNVRAPDNPGFRDKMETFYLAETLKYLYLLFSDDPNLIPLDKFVINTEAHPLPVYNS